MTLRPILVRVRTEKGETIRIESAESDEPETLFYNSSIVSEAENRIGSGGTWFLDPGYKEKVPDTLRLLEIENGALFFYKRVQQAPCTPTPKSSCVSFPVFTPLDMRLCASDGKIIRSMDPLLCLHQPSAMCLHCSPLDPFDQSYLDEKKIKHISYWSYAKSQGHSALGEFYIPEEPKIRTTICTAHLPYPKGMCSACQPSPITLQQQKFRMVDHIEFCNSEMVDLFINTWRQSANQTLAWLVGRYEPYYGVPLGIKATVHQLWIPIQDATTDGIAIDESPLYAAYESILDAALDLLEMERVGAIWTDLATEGSSIALKTTRGSSTFFLSGWESVWITRMQLLHPTLGCKSTASRWVSVIVTGDQHGTISLSAYQLSLQATALAKADLLTATSEAPFCAIWNASATSKLRPTPEVFYRDTIEQKKASPVFPTEFLITTLTHGFLPSQQEKKKLFDLKGTFLKAQGDLYSPSFMNAIGPYLLSIERSMV